MLPTPTLLIPSWATSAPHFARYMLEAMGQCRRRKYATYFIANCTPHILGYSLHKFNFKILLSRICIIALKPNIDALLPTYFILGYPYALVCRYIMILTLALLTMMASASHAGRDFFRAPSLGRRRRRNEKPRRTVTSPHIFTYDCALGVMSRAMLLLAYRAPPWLAYSSQCHPLYSMRH